MRKNTSLCIWSGCKASAVYHAYSTVGGGNVHACEKHVPAWLKAGLFTAFYAPEPGQTNTAAKDALLAHIDRKLAARALGQTGGSSTSTAKADAARVNGAKGGRPKKAQHSR